MASLLVLGATGVVGAAVVDAALADPRVSRVMTVTRRPLARSHPKLQPLVHANFLDFSDLTMLLHDVDACVGALGMAWPQAKSEEQYRTVTFDYVIAAARALHRANRQARFCFVSGHGASSTSRQTWARIKAETENAVTALYADRARIYRPGYIYPVNGREQRYWGDAVMRPFMPFRRAMARWITDSATVASALLYGALGGSITTPADNFEITRAAHTYAAGTAASLQLPA